MGVWDFPLIFQTNLVFLGLVLSSSLRNILGFVPWKLDYYSMFPIHEYDQGFSSSLWDKLCGYGKHYNSWPGKLTCPKPSYRLHDWSNQTMRKPQDWSLLDHPSWGHYLWPTLTHTIPDGIIKVHTHPLPLPLIISQMLHGAGYQHLPEQNHPVL